MKKITSTQNYFSVKVCFFIALLFMGFLTKSQVYNWAFNPSNTQNDRATSIECDAAGNSYVVVTFSGTIDADPGVGVTSFTSAGDRDIYVAKYDVSKNLVWAFQIGGSTAEWPYAISLDGSGNVYVAGAFGNTVDFNPGVGVFNLTANGFALNGFVAKYTNSGAFTAAYNVGFGGTAGSGSAAMDIGIDNSGNFFITGTFYGTVDLNPSAAVSNVTAAGSNAYYVSKFSSAGAFLLGFKLDYTGGSAQGLAISVLPTGDFYLTGVFGGTTDFDPSASAFNLTSLGTDDAFLAKYTSAGAFTWAFKLGAASVDGARSVVTDASGNAYITGVFIGSVDFDPSAATFNLTSSQDDAFVAKYTPTGAFSWAFKIGGVQSAESGTSLSMDANNDLYVTGFFLSALVDFDPGAGATIHSAANGIDIFVAKYSSAGNYIWSFSLSDNAGAQPTCIAANSLGVHLTGYFNGVTATIDCDPSAATANLNQIGGEDGIVARYSHCLSPNITSSPTSTFICASTNTSFTTAATGSGLTYQWQVNQGAGFSNVINGGVYSGATTATLVLTGPSIGMNNWSYQCVVSGMCSPSDTSAVASLTVVGPPSSPGPISGSPNSCAGSTITYSVAAVPGATSYSWTLPSGWSGVSFANFTSATTNSNSGIISVSASNSCGTSSATTLSVSPSSIPSQPSIISGGSPVCANTIQQYSVAAVSGASSYSWNASGGFAGSSATNIINVGVTNATSGTLTVVASNSCGVSPTQSLTVNINPSPTITVNSGSICAGQSFTMLPSGANSYTYQSGSPVVTPVSTISYTVMGTSAAGCVSAVAAVSTITVFSAPSVTVNSGSICTGQSFTMIPSGALTYTFSGGSAVVSPTNTSSFTVTGTDALGCINTLSAISNITVNPLPTINVVSTNSVLCVGQSATLTAASANTYTWLPSGSGNNIVISPTINTTYTVSGTDINGCTNAISFTQTVSACTGFSETNNNLSGVRVFPNPSNGDFTLDLTTKENITIEIYSVSGSLVFSTTALSDLNISFSNYEKGIYFIRARSSEQLVYSNKLIIQ